MFQSGRDILRICVIMAATSFALSVPSYAQRRGGGATLPPEVVRAQQEEADFNSLLRAQDADSKIKLIRLFLSNYSASQHRQVVYNLLVTAYYTKQDWNNFYATADKTIENYPDDVDVLTFVGWVIPHSYDPDDPDATKKLDKAENYEKHAIEVITSMTKLDGLTDAAFTAVKADRLSQAHSGLGLVYFRKQDYDNSVKELQQATQMATPPDTTDLYALGIGLEQLNRYSEAADAFQKCSVNPGQLQDRCKQSSDHDRTQAAAILK